MKLNFELRSQLPGQSWCVRAERRLQDVLVLHGKSVEIGRDWFVEGAWNGKFAEGGFDRSSLLMGSGGAARGDRMLLATPSHNLESLFLVEIDGCLHASNSLPFLLESSGLNLDLRHLGYKVDLISSMLGLERRARVLPTAQGAKVRLFEYTNLEVDANLQVRECPKPAVPEWADFNDYRRFLVEGIRALIENAGAAERGHRYQPLATMSAGYDSTASGALAQEAGCRHAITSIRGDQESDVPGTGLGDPLNDSGAPIAEALGMQVTEHDPNEIHSNFETALADFAATGDTAELNMISFEPELGHKLVFTGNSGGFWRLDWPPTSSPLARPDPAGSFGEFRLRVDFIHVPVPMLGAIHHDWLYQLSHSDEMRPWSVGGHYDRPIPRRILEGAGVPSELFAQVKKGGMLAALAPPSLEAFYRRNRAKRGQIARLRHLATWQLHHIQVKLHRRCVAIGLDWFTPTLVYAFPEIGTRSLAVHWGVETVRDRYRSCAIAQEDGNARAAREGAGVKSSEGEVRS